MADRFPVKSKGHKMMLGFIARRCAVELGHLPSPEEFADWANHQRDNGHSYCLFGKPISVSVAQVMLRHPGRLVTVRAEAIRKDSKLGIWNSRSRHPSDE